MSPVSFDLDASTLIEQSVVTPAARANLIVAGRDIYYDANNDGQPESTERFTNQGNAFEVASADGQSRYQLTRAYLGLNPEFVSNDRPQHVILNVNIMDPDKPDSVQFRQSAKINVYPEHVDHGWAHFDGPLSMKFVDEDLKLPAFGGPTVDLRVAISTPSVPGSPDSEGKTRRSNPTALIPGLIFPTATIAFPSASGEPITRRYDLDHFC